MDIKTVWAINGYDNGDNDDIELFNNKEKAINAFNEYVEAFKTFNIHIEVEKDDTDIRATYNMGNHVGAFWIEELIVH